MDLARNVPMWRFPHLNEWNRQRIEDSRGLVFEFLREGDKKMAGLAVSLPAAVVFTRLNPWYGRAVRVKPARTDSLHHWICPSRFRLWTWIWYGRTVWAYPPVLVSAKLTGVFVEIDVSWSESIHAGGMGGSPYYYLLNSQTLSSIFREMP
jgi:hypothetical protein